MSRLWCRRHIRCWEHQEVAADAVLQKCRLHGKFQVFNKKWLQWCHLHLKSRPVFDIKYSLVIFPCLEYFLTLVQSEDTKKYIFSLQFRFWLTVLMLQLVKVAYFKWIFCTSENRSLSSIRLPILGCSSNRQNIADWRTWLAPNPVVVIGRRTSMASKIFHRNHSRLDRERLWRQRQTPSCAAQQEPRRHRRAKLDLQVPLSIT